jgi:hypothetical protein
MLYGALREPRLVLLQILDIKPWFPENKWREFPYFCWSSGLPSLFLLIISQKLWPWCLRTAAHLPARHLLLSVSLDSPWIHTSGRMQLSTYLDHYLDSTARLRNSGRSLWIQTPWLPHGHYMEEARGKRRVSASED